MFRLLLTSLALLLISGCCKVFGVCTAVAVHSSISSPNEIVHSGTAPYQMALADTNGPRCTIPSK
jgi:hypothetical protein